MGADIRPHSVTVTLPVKMAWKSSDYEFQKLSCRKAGLKQFASIGSLDLSYNFYVKDIRIMVIQKSLVVSDSSF